MEKTKKIILLTAGLGVLATSVVVPIVILTNKKSDETNEAEKIVSKIKNKDIIISSNVPIQNQNEIQNAIKNQLKIDNPTLTSEDLKKISIVGTPKLKISEKVKVKITIKVGSKSESLEINVYLKMNLLKKSNISYGEGGVIFQDEFKNLWAAGNGTPLQVLEMDSSKNNYVNTGWNSNNDKTTGHSLLKGSNVDGGDATIFQDEFKNLWVMGYGSKLQVLKANQDGDGYINTGWTDDNDKTNGDALLKGSNIVDGEQGVIFQDKFKNLWAMGYGTSLQVLKVNTAGDGYVTTGWTDDNDKTTGDRLLKGSNIGGGWTGTIFQDEFKNLWVMGASYENAAEEIISSKLQVLKVNPAGDDYVTTGWIDDNDKTTGDPLLKGSNIVDGQDGVIFQDKFKNLWAMGNGTPLQVLKANPAGDGYLADGWKTDNDKSSGDALLKGSNIFDGEGGVIFQDEFKNLWAMGNGMGFSATEAMRIHFGKEPARIYGLGAEEDEIVDLSQKNIYSKLQVLKVNQNGDGYVSTGWTDDNDWTTGDSLLKDSNIFDGEGGVIFQDEFKNLWAMGSGTPLQVLKANPAGDGYVSTGWTFDNDKTTAAPLIKGSNIVDGWTGTIFQDELKNLWVMTLNQKLQVLEANPFKKGYVNTGWTSDNGETTGDSLPNQINPYPLVEEE